MSNEGNNDLEATPSTSENTDEREERKQNKKIDASLILSTIALVVTIAQLIVSTPYFTDFYKKSSFEISEIYPLLHDGEYISNFELKNTSKNTANNVEISMQVLTDDIVYLIPKRNIKIEFKDQGLFKDCFFSVDKLVPGENITIMVVSRYDSLIKYNNLFLSSGKKVINELDTSINSGSNVKESANERKELVFPNITLAKFDDGFGVIKRLPKEILFKSHRTPTVQ